MSKSEPWKRDWVEAEDLHWKASGGMSTVRLVRRISGSQEEIYALKQLKSSKDPERRRRMYREVVALETTRSDGTPRVIAHNCEAFEDASIALYVVLEYIAGQTLESFINANGAMASDDALALTGRLLDTLELFHENRCGHRDIKPDNLVLRDGNPKNPVLIDFGQTFNVEDEGALQTADAQHVGNRFLLLPEHAPYSGNKRDLRSDLTFCVGILFYALTGSVPSVLMDAELAMPHQRDAAKTALRAVTEQRQAQLSQIFDQGFQYNPDQRWQGVSALREALDRATKANSAVSNLEGQIAIARQRAALFTGNAQALEAVKIVVRRLDIATTYAASLLGDGYRASASRLIPRVRNGIVESWISCAIDAYSAGKLIDTKLNVTVVGTEIVVDEQLSDDRKEVRARLPLTDPNSDLELENSIASLIVNNVVSTLA